MYVDPFWFGFGIGVIAGILGTLIFALIVGRRKQVTMKQPKKLTKEQKQAVSAYHLNAKNWMLLEKMGEYLKIINKETGKTKIIDRNRRQADEKDMGRSDN